jgi:hypothetical protein
MNRRGNMPKRDTKEKLAQYWERAKEQGNLKDVLGEPIHRRRGRPKNPVPLRKVSVRLDERTLFYLRLIGRELKLPWQRMARDCLAEMATRRLRDLRIQKERQSNEGQGSETNASGVPGRAEVQAQEAERFKRAIGGSIRNLLIPERAAA